MILGLVFNPDHAEGNKGFTNDIQEVFYWKQPPYDRRSIVQTFKENKN